MPPPDYIIFSKLLKNIKTKHVVSYGGVTGPRPPFEQQQICNFKYPIIMHNKDIVDGVHRITKAVLEKKKYIKYINFNSRIFKKFLINKKKDYELKDINIHDFIELFYKRFNK